MMLFLWHGKRLTGSLRSFLLYFIAHRRSLFVHEFLEQYREKRAGKVQVFKCNCSHESRFTVNLVKFYTFKKFCTVLIKVSSLIDEANLLLVVSDGGFEQNQLIWLFINKLI